MLPLPSSEPPFTPLDLDSFFLDKDDFELINGWLIDPDHTPMTDTDDGLGFRNVDLGHGDPVVAIDERMEKVTLLDPKDNNDEGKSIRVLDKDDGVSEVVYSVNDPIKATKETEEEESSSGSGSDESEDSSNESSSSSSASSTRDEEEESSSSEEEEEHEKAKEVDIEVEEGEINGDDLHDLPLGSDGEEQIPKGPIKSKHEIEV